MDVQSLSPELVHPSSQQPSESIPIESIDRTFGHDHIDLISSSLNSRILSFSDEFFAPASSLINPRPPTHRPGVYVPTGAWYDGWETRRHNPAPFDWVVIRLGVASGVVRGIEIDTAFFNGNQAPCISVQGCFQPGEGVDEEIAKDSFDGWQEVLGRRECGPSQRQAWNVTGQKQVTHVRLCMYPDGGIARFRLYGQALPVWPDTGEVELSAAVMGGVAIKCSDQHFGEKANLLLPGRGIDMGDGWETKRSRGEGHVDWVVVKLGARGRVSRIVIDTAHFRGNFPQGVKVEGADAEGASGEEGNEIWREVLGVRRLGPDQEFTFEREDLTNVDGNKAYTHIKMTIIPDGGVKRLRVFGTRA